LGTKKLFEEEGSLNDTGGAWNTNSKGITTVSVSVGSGVVVTKSCTALAITVKGAVNVKVLLWPLERKDWSTQHSPGVGALKVFQMLGCMAPKKQPNIVGKTSNKGTSQALDVVQHPTNTGWSSLIV